MQVADKCASQRETKSLEGDITGDASQKASNLAEQRQLPGDDELEIDGVSDSTLEGSLPSDIK